MIGKQHMKIKVGDWIKVDCNGSYREGIIQDIKIGTCETDPAGELGHDVKELDTKYFTFGSVGFGDSWWCYFNQIKEVKNAETKNETTI